MNRICITGLLWSLAIFSATGQETPEKHTPDIRGRIQTVDMVHGKVMTLDLQDYWRSNLDVKNGTITPEKRPKAQHVPGLIEYRIYIVTPGLYSIQLEAERTHDARMHLTVNGKEKAVLFESPIKNSEIINEVALHKGLHYIRLTSEKLNTSIPHIKTISLQLQKAEEIARPILPSLVKKGIPSSVKKGWEFDVSRKIHLDFHTSAYVDKIGNQWDPEEFAATLADNHINAVTIFAKGHHGFAFYNTKIGTRHPGLDFDLLKEQIKACHKRGIKVFAYFSVNVDELWATTEEGENVNWETFQNVDANPEKSYIKDYTWPMIREVVENYDIDGFWFDFPGYDQFVSGTIDLIRSIKPNLVSAYNHQYNKPREELAKQDIMEIEAWEHSQSLYRLPYIARYAHGATPIVGMTTRFWHRWGDFGRVNDAAMLQFETAVSFANGCGITIGDQLHPNGRLEPAVYQVIGQAMKLGKTIEPYVNGASFVPYVAYLRQDLKASSTLIDSGIHFNVVDEKMPLDAYKALVVPMAGKLSDNYLQKLEGYVKNGGKLIIYGNPSEKLQSILGVEKYDIDVPIVSIKDKENLTGAFIRNRNKVLPTAAAMDIMVKQPIVAVKPIENTQEIAPLVWQMNHGTTHRLSHQQSPPMDEVSGYSAITYRKLGKGEIIFCPLSILEAYAKDGFTQMRHVFKDMFQKVVKPEERLVEVESTVGIEVSIMQQENKTVIHLVNGLQSRRATLEPMPVIDGFPLVEEAILKINKELVNNRTLKIVTDNLSELSPLKEEGNQIIYRVPNFSINSVFVLEN